jgi:hypothetical protein
MNSSDWIFPIRVNAIGSKLNAYLGKNTENIEVCGDYTYFQQDKIYILSNTYSNIPAAHRGLY